MRSLLLTRFTRLCLKKPSALVVRHLCGFPSFTETPLCHIVTAEHCGESLRDGDIGRLKITKFSISNDWTLEKTVPMDLMKETGTIGASYGWVATLKDGVVCLQDDLNPSASDAEPKRISLPPLTTLPHCQTQMVTNIAMSSSSPEEEDCILAVKFLGSQLSLCRPARKEKSEWFNIRIEDPGFFSSRVMYSKRDKMFSMPASGGTYIGSWDLEVKNHTPKLQPLRIRKLPEFVQSKWARLNSCCTTEQLVESRPSGHIFMVKQFKERNNYKDGKIELYEVMVFNLDDDGNAFYTEDIGDISIFVSNSEPFCLQASLFDHFNNSVYFIDKRERGLMGLDDKCKISDFNTYHAPYWIPPQSYNNANRSDSL